MTGTSRKYTVASCARADLAQRCRPRARSLAQVPVVVRRDARRVARVGRLVLVGAGEADLARRRRARSLSAMKKRGVVKEAGFGVALELELGTGDPVEAAAQHDVALRPRSRRSANRRTTASRRAPSRGACAARRCLPPSTRVLGRPRGDRRAGRSRRACSVSRPICTRRRRGRRSPALRRGRGSAAPATLRAVRRARAPATSISRDSFSRAATAAAARRDAHGMRVDSGGPGDERAGGKLHARCEEGLQNAVLLRMPRILAPRAPIDVVRTMPTARADDNCLPPLRDWRDDRAAHATAFALAPASADASFRRYFRVDARSTLALAPRARR